MQNSQNLQSDQETDLQLQAVLGLLGNEKGEET